MGDVVVYTCITGGYDALISPKVVGHGIDYVCFSDQDINSEVWDVRPIPDDVDGLSAVKKQRFLKLNPHLFFPEYDVSVWVDGNVTIKGDLNELLFQTGIDDSCSVYVPKHPLRDCLYKEADAVVSLNKDRREVVEPQMRRYRDEGFPEAFGLLQSNIMIRRHHDEGCIRLMRAWSDEVMKYSHRDQLSFNYALWKNRDVSVTFLDSGICESKWFSWSGGHGGRKE